MNIFNFTGNLGQAAEVTTTSGGMTICTFSVAVKSGYGERQKANWVRCKIFGKRAEGGLPNYLVKGTQVAVSGELSLNEWESDKGTKTSLEVAVNSIDLIGGKTDAQPPKQQAFGSYAQPKSKPAAAKFRDDFDDELPF